MQPPLLRTNADTHLLGNVVAASIAHEVRQPLTAIIMSAAAGFRFLDQTPPDLDRARDAFQRIVADGHRAGAVVEDIRANFKSDPAASTSLDVGGLIQGALALTRSELEKHRIRVHIDAAEHLPPVRGNRIQLQQVLLNLIANAVDAMAHCEGVRALCVSSSAHGEEHVVVAVADTGPGVDADSADRIFDPLYTTKSHGMGMGLAICRAIIEAHGSKLWLAPNTPVGAVFRFTLRVDRTTAQA
jgi:C4-dicarboxylate-specific signal transduction histidine kinase